MPQIKIRIQKKELNSNVIKAEKKFKKFKEKEFLNRGTLSEENKQARPLFWFGRSPKLFFLLTLVIIFVIFVLWLINLGRLFDFNFQEDQFTQILERVSNEVEHSFEDFQLKLPQIHSQPAVDELSNTEILNREQVEILKNKILQEVNQ